MTKLFDGSRPPTESDVRALKEFLFSELVADELALHKLLEIHPSLVGILGFSEFASEHPLYKRGENNQPILLDKRGRDRADFIAAREAPILTPLGLPYKSAHVIELKSAAAPISLRSHGTRLSDEASRAVGQLRDYKEWLTTVPQNRELFAALGWDIRVPMLYLVMGTHSEFQNDPGHLEGIRGRLQEDGIFLYTVDDVLRTAERQVRDKSEVTDVIRWTIAPSLPSATPAVRILTEVAELALLNPTAVRFQRFFEGIGEVHRDYRKYRDYVRRDFFGICAYCRLPDRLAGGPEAFVIDHFRPVGLFPDLRNEYTNLYYACSACNRMKGPMWPPDSSAFSLLDPMVDQFADHFSETDNGAWVPKTKSAEYTLEALRLNRRHLIVIRQLLRTLASKSGAVNI